ncbi:hypothetical protein [Phenylobacterium sp.]|uniref:hypothetical protein n=1 Tax=Phenylobacterium sp. TaxID=1871053 RepID=UPI00391D9EB4
MKPFALRRLAAGERELCAEVFGPALDAGRVRLFALPAWTRAFVAGPALIVWPARTARADFAAPHVPLRDQATFVHELAHVWQAQHGVSLLLAKLKAGDRPASYAYDLAQGPDFQELNIEQQAMVVEHAFLASRGGHAPHPPELYANARSAWRRA